MRVPKIEEREFQKAFQKLSPPKASKMCAKTVEAKLTNSSSEVYD